MGRCSVHWQEGRPRDVMSDSVRYRIQIRSPYEAAQTSIVKRPTSGKYTQTSSAIEIVDTEAR